MLRNLENGSFHNMTSVRKVTGTAMAAAAAALLIAGTVGVSVSAQAAAVHCGGVNSCKGTSSCKSANNACKGMNACKGQGWTEKASAEECTAAGGTVLEG